LGCASPPQPSSRSSPAARSLVGSPNLNSPGSGIVNRASRLRTTRTDNSRHSHRSLRSRSLCSPCSRDTLCSLYSLHSRRTRGGPVGSATGHHVPCRRYRTSPNLYQRPLPHVAKADALAQIRSAENVREALLPRRRRPRATKYRRLLMLARHPYDSLASKCVWWLA
jgi:hypothetical protein